MRTHLYSNLLYPFLLPSLENLVILLPLNFLLFHNLCKLFSFLQKDGSKRMSTNFYVLFMPFAIVGLFQEKEENLICECFLLCKTNSMPKDNICCDKRLRKGIIFYNSFAYDANNPLEEQIFLSALL